MDAEYPIILGGQQVGKAAVRREGLYLCFFCQCHLGGEMVWRLVAETKGKKENLGIPVPEGAYFVLRSRIPAKKLGEGPLTVRAVPQHGTLTEKFVPLSPQEPFAYLRELENAYLEIRNGKMGIVLREKESSAERI